MKHLPLLLKRTLFYPTFLLLSSGFFLLDWRGFIPLTVAAASALLLHIGVNGYEIWQQKRSSNQTS